MLMKVIGSDLTQQFSFCLNTSYFTPICQGPSDPPPVIAVYCLVPRVRCADKMMGSCPVANQRCGPRTELWVGSLRDSYGTPINVYGGHRSQINTAPD